MEQPPNEENSASGKLLLPVAGRRNAWEEKLPAFVSSSRVYTTLEAEDQTKFSKRLLRPAAVSSSILTLQRSTSGEYL
jgi:hypothetical protein